MDRATLERRAVHDHAKGKPAGRSAMDSRWFLLPHLVNGLTLGLLMDLGRIVHEGPARALLEDATLRTKLLGI